MLFYVLLGILLLLYITIEVNVLLKQHNINPLEAFTPLEPEDIPIKNLLVSDIYPAKVSANTILKYNKYMWEKSQPQAVNANGYKQVTNNIEYPINPDNGSCIPAVFCYTFYANNKLYPNNHVSNMLLSDNPTITPYDTKDKENNLPYDQDVRVGYFTTKTGPFF